MLPDRSYGEVINKKGLDIADLNIALVGSKKVCRGGSNPPIREIRYKSKIR